ncbi:MAG: AsnC family transcriptional regulator [Candidatus Hydrothermarchaeota archaeon]
MLGKKEIDLLGMMITESKNSLSPYIDLEGISYPEADDVLGTRGEETIKILEGLHSNGFLIKKTYDKIYSCPNCHKFVFKLKSTCSLCNSSNIRKASYIEHFECGHIDLEDEFSRLRCPKCDLPLKSLGVDYTRVTDVYFCNKCKNFFQVPNEEINCIYCNSTFRKNNVETMETYEYLLNPEKIADYKEEILRSYRAILTPIMVKPGVPLDKLDSKILERLQQNSRKSFREIANEIGVSEATIRYRVKRLEEDKIIERYTMSIDPAKVGRLFPVALLVKVTPQNKEKVISYLKDLEETKFLTENASEWNILAVLYLKSKEDLNSVLDKISLEVEDNLPLVVLKMQKRDFRFKIP